MIKGNFDKIYITKVDMDRSAEIDELRRIADRINLTVTHVDDAAQFIESFRKETPNKCLVVLGSMYLLGEIKSKKYS